jgi:hypothetical protein
MTTRTLFPTLGAFVALLALACAGGSSQKTLATGVPPPADAKLAAWNQQRVAAIALELAGAVDQMQDAFRASPIGGTIGSGQANAQLRMRDRMRLLRNESRYLANALKDGADRDQTLSVYERIGTLASDAREEARKMFLPDPVFDTFVKAGEIWNRLTPYYVGV